MRRAIRTELWKAFHEPTFWLAALAGAVIAALSFRDCALMMEEWHRSTAARVPPLTPPDPRLSTEGYSLFALSLPYHDKNFSSMVFMYVWPILAALPYGSSYMRDRRTGVYDQIVSRVGRRKYFGAKYLAVFVTGGIVVSGTVLVSVLADAMVTPVWRMHISVMEIIHNGAFLSTVYYSHPWAHIFCWCGVLFLFGGATACLTFLAWTGIRLRAVVAVIPFALYFVLSTAVSRLRSSGLVPPWEFLRKLGGILYMVSVRHPAYPGTWALIITGMITAATLAVGYMQAVKHELD